MSSNPNVQISGSQLVCFRIQILLWTLSGNPTQQQSCLVYKKHKYLTQTTVQKFGVGMLDAINRFHSPNFHQGYSKLLTSQLTS